MKRLFDIFFSFWGLVFLFPLFLILSIWILIDSSGGIFYLQQRAGKNRVYFGLIKFRSMATGSDKKGLLTVGASDSRVTKSGYYIRKYKMDELPQLINVLIGQMTLVGPRPEVKKYVDLYNEKQLEVLTVRPGITDLASLEYFNENELLANSSDPEQTYINEIMPHKLGLNIKYIQEKTMFSDFKIILKTIAKIFN